MTEAKCIWCMQPGGNIRMTTFDHKQILMHQDCHVEYLEVLGSKHTSEWVGHDRLATLIGAEIERVGDREPMACVEVNGGIFADSPLFSCQMFRAQYERKKASIQNRRYKRAEEEASRLETKEISQKELEDTALTHRDLFTVEGKIDINRLMVVMADKAHVKFGKNKAYWLKASLEMHFPELFEQ
jgi:hypothetical protein